MQYEILERNGKYVWELYSKWGYPLRKVLKSGECETRQQADAEAYFALKTTFFVIILVFSLFSKEKLCFTTSAANWRHC